MYVLYREYCMYVASKVNCCHLMLIGKLWTVFLFKNCLTTIGVIKDYAVTGIL